MSDPFVVRRAAPDDAEALHDLGVAVTYPTYAPITGAGYADYVMDRWWRSEYIAESMSRTTHYVAERDGEVLGTAVVGALDGETVLWKLYVHPAEHRGGIGSALLDAAIAGLGGSDACLLLSYIDGNERAAAFYRAKGFTYVRTETDGHGVAHQWMSLALPRT